MKRERKEGATPSLSSGSRLLIFAPHPDDESLACGILLQNAAEAGAAVLVIYLTDGENNPWPQRSSRPYLPCRFTEGRVATTV